MPLWKILVKGTTPMDVQGVNLRESIVGVAEERGIKCKVSNKKGSGTVEVVCNCDSANATILKGLIQNIHKKNPLVDQKKISVSDPSQYQDPAITEASVSGYDIEREDDLTEMVWALQNAGKALMLQEKMRRDSMFRALNAEIEAFRSVLNNIDADVSHKECFPVIAIEGFLSNPPEGCNELQAKLYALYRYAKNINQMIRDKTDKPRPTPFCCTPRVYLFFSRVVLPSQLDGYT